MAKNSSFFTGWLNLIKFTERNIILNLIHIQFLILIFQKKKILQGPIFGSTIPCCFVHYHHWSQARDLRQYLSSFYSFYVPRGPHAGELGRSTLILDPHINLSSNKKWKNLLVEM